MSDWPVRTLDQLGTVERGKSRHRPRNDPVLYGGEYPFFQTGDVKAAEFYLSDHTQTYNEVGLAQSRLWEAGTLCITIAANIAESAVLAIPACFPDSVVGFIPTADVADVRFVKYLLDHTKLRMQAISRGTTQDNLSLDKLLSLKVSVPSLGFQQKIAAVLAAHDELIENNLWRIEILEEMAQAVYREWLVNFRYPGHENVALVDSPLGPIPEGWDVVIVGDAVDLDPRVRLPRDTELRFVPMGSLVEGSMVVEGYETRIGPSGSQFSNGDTLLARITPSLENGKTGFVQFLSDGEIACGSTEFIVMRSRTLTPEFVYLLARTDDFRGVAIKSMVGASGRQRVQEASIANYAFPHPDSSTLRRFHGATAPIFRIVQNLVDQNANLRSTRDLLLPKLVSGELDVSDLDIETDWLAS